MVRLEEITRIRASLERCFDLARSVEVHLAGNVHFGEQALTTGSVKSGPIGLGERVTWRAKHFWIWQTLTSEVTGFERPTYFQDKMISGAFRCMTHDHYFRTVAAGETEMRDVFYFAAPIPVLGLLTEKLVLRRYMRDLLRERNGVLKRIAEGSEWRKYVRGSGETILRS